MVEVVVVKGCVAAVVDWVVVSGFGGGGRGSPDISAFVISAFTVVDSVDVEADVVTVVVELAVELLLIKVLVAVVFVAVVVVVASELTD